MTLLIAVLLGLLQGITEFLPISSSGHLRLAGAAFGIDDPQTLFDVCVHGGTLGAILAFYRRDVGDMLRGLMDPRWTNPGFRTAILIAIGTIPAGLVGVLAGDWLEANMSSVALIGGFLILNGGILMTSRNKGTGGRGLHELTVRDAILIGLAQAFALFRGISRSGTTISAGLLLGIERETTATFSFLLSIPAITGAVVLKLGEAMQSGEVAFGPLVAGTLTAAVSGYVALTLLIRVVKAGGFHHFAWYCWALGAIAIAGALR